MHGSATNYQGTSKDKSRVGDSVTPHDVRRPLHASACTHRCEGGPGQLEHKLEPLPIRKELVVDAVPPAGLVDDVQDDGRRQEAQDVGLAVTKS